MTAMEYIIVRLGPEEYCIAYRTHGGRWVALAERYTTEGEAWSALEMLRY